MATTTGEKHGLKQGRAPRQRPKAGQASTRPRDKPVISCQVTQPFDRKIRLASIVRGLAHSKAAAYSIELGFPQWEAQNPVTTVDAITPTVLEALNEAGFTYEEAVEYIKGQASGAKKGGK